MPLRDARSCKTEQGKQRQCWNSGLGAAKETGHKYLFKKRFLSTAPILSMGILRRLLSFVETPCDGANAEAWPTLAGEIRYPLLSPGRQKADSLRLRFGQALNGAGPTRAAPQSISTVCVTIAGEHPWLAQSFVGNKQ
jgi:hypothetical protein